MLRHFQKVTLHAVRAASEGGDALRRVDGTGPALRPARVAEDTRYALPVPIEG